MQTHKLGEAGFKPGADGAYWNALENHNEAFKFIEDAIAAVGINVSKTCYVINGGSYRMTRENT